MGGFTDVLALFEGLQFEKNQCAISVTTDDPNLPVDNFLGSFDDFFDRHPALNDLCISYVNIHDGKKWFLTCNRRCLDQTEI
uniref:DUF695 domain-containing protein n=1 Tax=Panagrellus redivivus TaxID=6233 RepID=A0A7E4VT27_PANRE